MASIGRGGMNPSGGAVPEAADPTERSRACADRCADEIRTLLIDDHVGVCFLLADASGKLRSVHRSGRPLDLGRAQAVARRTTLVDGITRILGVDGQAVGVFPIDRRGNALGVAEVSAPHHSLEVRGPDIEASIGRLSEELHRRAEHHRRRRELDVGLAWTAHELRGPMVAARLQLERAAGSMTAAGADMVNTAIRELARLTEGLDSILHWSVGDVTIHRRRFDLVELTAQAIDCCVAQTGEDRIVLDGSDRLSVRADPLHLRSAIDNVVRNALLYSTPGTKVHVTVEPRDGSPTVEVENEGHDIPRADLDRLFEPLARGSTGSGYGLGLFVARRILERHGGTLVWHQAEEGRISFELRLPVEATA